jgi:hypothetical protein
MLQMLPPAAAAIRNCLCAWKIMSGNQDKVFVVAARGKELLIRGHDFLYLKIPELIATVFCELHQA